MKIEQKMSETCQNWRSHIQLLSKKWVKSCLRTFIEFFHIITFTKLANWDKSTEVQIDHHFLYLLCTKINSKVKIH